MKRYELEIIGSDWNIQYVIADGFTPNSNGFYEFYTEEHSVIAVYPIERTIIKNIELNVSE